MIFWLRVSDKFNPKNLLKCLPKSVSTRFQQFSQRNDTRFSFTEDCFVICGKHYKKDEYTNLTPYLVPRITRNLLQQKAHPLTLVAEATKQFFKDFDYFNFEDPVVNTYANFDSLLIPKNHVSRTTRDSYYLTKDLLLRTHSSAHQTHSLSSGSTKFICIADVYRRDEIDRTHYPCFHQCEAFDTFQAHDLSLESIYKEDGQVRDEKSQERYSEEATAKVERILKTTIEKYVKFLLGDDIKFQWVNAYFPFTHPSWELEIFFENKWLEVVGAGIVEEKILQNHKVHDRISWALGFGLERLAMVRYKIPDVRLFWTKDLGFIHQFSSLDPLDRYTFKPLPRFPPCINDMSFWLPHESSEWSPNDFYDLCRSIGEDIIEHVELLDDFTHPQTGRRSHCYKIFYRSCDKSLSKAFVNKIHDKIAEEVTRKYNVEVRNKLPPPS